MVLMIKGTVHTQSEDTAPAMFAPLVALCIKLNES